MEDVEEGSEKSETSTRSHNQDQKSVSNSPGKKHSIPSQR